MLSLYKISLGPLLFAQAKWLRRKAIRLPEPHGPRTRVANVTHGVGSLRLLFVGDSSVAGAGVENQTEALASQVAKRVLG